MSALAAVLFDMDGVLIDSARVADRLLVEAAARLGADLSADEMAGLNGASGVEFWTYVKETYALDGSVSEYVDAYDAAAEVAAYDTTFIAPGIVDLIGALVDAGVPAGLVTSATSWRAGKVIDLAGVRSSLSAIVSADDVTRTKPAPDAYLTAAETLGVDPSACLAVEDSTRGAEAAWRAGMVVALYTGFGVRAEPPDFDYRPIADFRSESPDSLRDLHYLMR